MRESIKNRAAAIRQYVDNRNLPADPATIYRYSVTAAQWEATRLLIDKGKGTAADDRRRLQPRRPPQRLPRQIPCPTLVRFAAPFAVGTRELMPQVCRNSPVNRAKWNR